MFRIVNSNLIPTHPSLENRYLAQWPKYVVKTPLSYDGPTASTITSSLKSTI